MGARGAQALHTKRETGNASFSGTGAAFFICRQAFPAFRVGRSAGNGAAKACRSSFPLDSELFSRGNAMRKGGNEPRQTGNAFRSVRSGA